MGCVVKEVVELSKTTKALRKGLLNEVTVTIMETSNKVNYHETFMIDTTQHNSFEYKGKKYNMPPQDTGHYPISFWNFGVKLAIFFERHKTLASLFDWFNYRKKAGYEIGYLYWEDNPDPDKMERPDYDWALENYKLQRNQTIEGSFRDAERRLRGKEVAVNRLMIIGLIIIAAIAIIVAVVVITGQGHAPPAPIQNVTGT